MSFGEVLGSGPFFKASVVNLAPGQFSQPFIDSAFSDPGLGSYKKLVIADGRLVGAVLFGDTADGLWYLELIRSGASIEAIRDDLMFGRAMAERSMPERLLPERLMPKNLAA